MYMNVNGSGDQKIPFLTYVCALVLYYLLYRCKLLTHIRYGPTLPYASEMGLSTFRVRYNHTLLAIILCRSKNPSVNVTKWGDPCTSSDLSTRWQGHPNVRFGHTRLSLHIAV